MGRCLQIVGFGWALLGSLNVLFLLGSNKAGTLAIMLSVLFNMFLFILPGLGVGGMGSLMVKKS